MTRLRLPRSRLKRPPVINKRYRRWFFRKYTRMMKRGNKQEGWMNWEMLRLARTYDQE